MRQRFWPGVHVVIAALLLLSATAGLAQGNCQDFRGIVQASYVNGVGWLGPLYATLGGAEALFGEPVGGTAPVSTWHGVTGQDRGGLLVVGFGVNGSFTIETQHGAYPNPPGKSGFGYYQALTKIVEGTGRFQNASGNLILAGPYLLWPLNPAAPDAGLDGRWNAEMSGKVCDVAPRANP